MAVTGGCRSSWLTAGPPGRSLTSGAAIAAAVASQAPVASPSCPTLLQSAFIVFIVVTSVSKIRSPRGTRAAQPRMAQGHSQFVRQRRPQLGTQVAPDRDAPPLPRQLDQ